jgi:rubrerythrin
VKPLETTPEEVLRKAIQSEVETRVFYQKLAERAGSPAVKKRMLELADEELLHRAKMERKYREEIHQAPPDPDPVTIDLAWDVTDLTMTQALKIALERERESESNFRFLAERVPNTPLGNLFAELADIEWKHKADLQAEYDASYAADPEQFLRDLS